jgi:hypothetical protein
METSFSAFKLTDGFRPQRSFQRSATSDGSATIDIAGHGITSLQAIGSLVSKAQEALNGIVTAGAIGSQAVKPRVASAAIVSAETIGSHAVKARISSAGIVSAQTIGSDVVKARTAANGIATSESLGSDALKGQIASSGIATSQVLGSDDVNAMITAAEIVSAETIGSDVAKALVVASSIVDEEAIGAPAITLEVLDGTIQCLGIASTEGIGVFEIAVIPEQRAVRSGRGYSHPSSQIQRVRSWRPSPVTISMRSVASGEEFGTPAIVILIPQAFVATAGVNSEEVHGEPGFLTLLAAKAILSGEVVEAPLSDLIITANGIVDPGAMGVPAADFRRLIIGIHHPAARVGVMAKSRISVKSAAKVVGIHRAPAKVGIVAKSTIGVRRSTVFIGKRIPFVIKCKKGTK